MAYTLSQFADDCRAALRGSAGPEALDGVRAHLTQALTDPDFVAEHIPPSADQERKILYEDAELGFCICAHAYRGAKQGSPHDHGPTWAIYGQVAGETEMTDWAVVTPARNGRPGKVRLDRSYRLKPGDAHVYPVGAVHAPLREGPTRLIRVEGKNTETLQRTPLEAE